MAVQGKVWLKVTRRIARIDAAFLSMALNSPSQYWVSEVVAPHHLDEGTKPSGVRPG